MYDSDSIMSFIMTNWQSIIVGFVLAVAILTFFYYRGSNKIPRGLILIFVVLIEIAVLCIFWKEIETFISKGTRHVWLKGLLPLFLAAIPAYLLWHWRDTNRRQELKHQGDDLKLKENNDAWTNFIKYQKIAEDNKKEHSDATRAAAIYALGEYYEREVSQFPNQVHVFFKKFLDDFWDKQEVYHKYIEQIDDENCHYRVASSENSIPPDALYQATIHLICFKNQLPEYIRAVHRIIKEKSIKVKIRNKNLFHHQNGFLLDFFNFSCADLQGANFSHAKGIEPNFTGANLKKSNFSKADLFLPNFLKTDLQETSFVSAKTKSGVFWYANLFKADFSKIDALGIKLHGTNRKKSIWTKAVTINIMKKNRTKKLKNL